MRHDILLAKMARRIQDAKVLHLLKMIMKASGKQGVPQGGTISPLLSNIYLNEVDKMLEKAKEVTKEGKYTHIRYARFADDIVILVDKYQERWKWLEKAVQKRVGEEFEKIGVEVNEEKTRIVDLSEGEKFDFLGFNFRLIENQKGKTMVLRTPKQEARNALIAKLREVFKRHRAQQLERKPIEKVNSILRGWVNYFRVGNSTKSFKYIREWVERKVRRQLTRTRKKRGFGWKKWSSEQIYSTLGLYKDYEIRYVRKTKAKTDNQVK
ncbi:reverse transcriptase domain-containing protein [Wolbachia endosymbiont of Psylliodes chrysocephala]|uniref:reverse transcriptase domain-containing protein n=1 Tax=Wolbachia endosymbiont of Psylliodes chrysocephala TaxID=2883236 RepID=UPI0020A09458|nr:reverse transcriptase domain-containing protein [Wolbachia endosymbiont of Psylliodes chrysocephala]